MPTLFPFVTMIAWRQFSRLACALYRWRLVFLPLYLLFLITAPAQADLGSNVVQFGTKDENSTSLAWGDWDGDGDLDLAVGNAFSVNQVYENDAGQLKLDPTQGFGWRANVAQWTTSVAWGDWDGDGDLDLAVGNKFSVNQVYENDAGQLKLDPAQGFGWQADEAQETTSLAWGDWDGDGDLDLAVGNKGNNRVYENEAGTLQWTPANSLGWEASEVHETNSLAWGDWDKDGDLDLAVGNYNASSQVYENVGGTLHLDPAQDLGWQADAAQRTYSVAWGDWDNDGDLDLAFGNAYSNVLPTSYSTIYENEAGQLRLDQANGLGAVLDYPATWLGWGDMDGDGDLDLAGNANSAGGLISVFENVSDSQGRRLQVAWQSGISQENTQHDNTLAWGDWDGDGDLDLAVGNHGINLLYQNEGQNLNLVMEHANGTKRLAWGDWDGDHDLDLALGNQNQPSQVYENTGGKLELWPMQGLGWQSADALDTRSVAWGDWDNDGDLDLAVGNHNAPNQVYENDGETLTLAPLQGAGWQAIESEKSTSVAWGDWDGDSDLDLTVGNDGVNRVYENNDGTLQFDPVTGLGWQAANAMHTYSVAWGDWDDDGDLDLAVGTATGAQVYANQGATLNPTPDWFTEDVQQTDVVAWGDWDGDGDLDLAAGGSALRIYENEHGKLSLDTAQGFGWQANDGLHVRGLAWGDWDGDGDLDLGAAGLGFTVVYENIDGDLRSAPASGFGWRRQTEGGNNDVAWADWNGDGDLELVRADNAGFELFENPQQGQHTLVNNPPVLMIKPPASAPNANFYAMSKILTDSVIAIPYTVSDDEGDPVGQIRAFYSVNGGGHWTPAVATSATVTTNLIAGEPYLFYWDTAASGFFGQSDQVVVRLEAYAQPAQSGQPGQFRYVHSTPGFIQRPAIAAVTLPFRVRGTQVRVVDSLGDPVANALVYRLRQGAVTGADLMPSAEQPLPTTYNGYLPGRGVLAMGDQLLALAPITHSLNYTLYATSGIPNDNPTSLTMTAVTQAGVQTLRVSNEQPLLLFDLTVALEWDAGNDALFYQGLTTAFQRASAILYDVSDGQIALGNVRIYPDRGRWLSANVVIHANNNLRPRASMGGLVRRTRDEVEGWLNKAQNQKGTLPNAYLPGQIRMGPVWDPFGQNSAELTQDWQRALAHELAHYLLYLPDNYMGVEKGLLRITDCQGSFMTDAYNPDYSEWLTPAEWRTPADNPCLRTVAEQLLTGRSDWETITHFYPALRIPLKKLAGPALLPLNITQVQVMPPSTTKPVPVAARNYDLRNAAGEVTVYRQAQAFVLQGAATNPAATSALLLLGSTGIGSDRIVVRGGRVGDLVCLFAGAEDPMQVGCTLLTPQSTSINVRPVPGWAPTIQVTPVTSTTFQITVTQSGLAGDLQAELFPAYGTIGSAHLITPTRTTLTNLGDGRYAAQLVSPYPVFEGFVRVYVQADPLQQQTITQFFLGDGWGPPNVWMGANRAWSANFRSKEAPVASGDGKVTILRLDDLLADTGATSIQAVSDLPNLPPWLTPVGSGYRIQSNSAITRTLMFQYNQRDVPPGYEQTLTIYYLAPSATDWQRLPTGPLAEGVDVADNLAVAMMPHQARGEGIYALMATVELPALVEGWNPFNYPVGATQSITRALSSLGDGFTTVYQYQPGAPLPWPLYDRTVTPAFASLVNTLQTMAFRHNYLLYATKAITPYLSVVGDAGAQGGAAQGALVEPPAAFYGVVEMSIGAAPGTPIHAFINNVQCGESKLQAWQGQLAYVLQVKADTGDGCGAAGKRVNFVVAGQLLPYTANWDNRQARQVTAENKIYLPIVTR